MKRKPRFKVKRRNDGGSYDRHSFGNKRWTPVYDDWGQLGFTLSREQASDLYHELTAMHPDQVYAIFERR